MLSLFFQAEGVLYHCNVGQARNLRGNFKMKLILLNQHEMPSRSQKRCAPANMLSLERTNHSECMHILERDIFFTNIS